MAATSSELCAKESPQEHANSTGACCSAGEDRIPCNSSAPRSPKGGARRTQKSPQSAAKRSSTGKAHRTQVSCSSNSEKVLASSSTAGKDCGTLLANALVTGVNETPTPCERGSQDPPTENAVHAHEDSARNGHTGDGKQHVVCTNSNMKDANADGVVSGAAAEANGTTSPNISSSRHPCRLASSRDDAPRFADLNSPPKHAFRSMSLKSGTGPYEVLTPRKSNRAALHGTSPRRSGSAHVKSGPKDHTAGHGTRKLGRALTQSSFQDAAALGSKDVQDACKNCKTSNLDSVCFIANDGKIAAAHMGPATTCHFHHCSSPKCAANPNYQPPESVPCKKVLLSKTRSVPSQQWRRTKSNNNASHIAKDNSCAAALKTNLPKTNQSSGESRHGENVCCEGGVPNQVGKESSGAELASSVRTHDVDAHEICRGDGQKNVLASLHTSPVGNDDDIEKRSLHEEDGDEKNKPPHQCGDKELSCSNDGMDASTPNRYKTKGAFGDLSNTEFTQSDGAAKASFHARKTSMERIRQKYLESLKEQEAERVRLKKQEMSERKQAGEWMLDCAMGEILHKLAPDGEAGVKVLVEAFETIMQHTGLEVHEEENSACCTGAHILGCDDSSKPLQL